MATTAINSTTMIDRLYILSRTYEDTMVFEPSIGTIIVQAEFHILYQSLYK